MLTPVIVRRKNMKLFLNALTKFLIGLLLVGLLIFLPAGTLAYPGGILFL